MKRLARRYCYWPSIDKDIEHTVRSCASCALNSKQPSKTFHPWETPTENFERIHMDYAGPFNGYHFLVVIDAKSKWPEVRITQKAPSSTITIDFLQDIFATHGYPTVLVSDNATIFTSQEFTDFCQNRGIFQKFIAPGHPATNGLAERHVQTLKTSLKNCAEDMNKNIKTQVQEILFRYRAVPLNCGQSPAELYLHRKIRTQLDAIRPISSKVFKKTEFIQVPRSFKVGERVLVRTMDGWKFGKVLFRLGFLHYKVKLDSGYIGKRHLDQLKRTSVPDETENLTNPIPSPSTKKPHKQVRFEDDLETAEIIIPRTQQQEEDSKSVPPDLRRSKRVRRPPNRMNI